MGACLEGAKKLTQAAIFLIWKLPLNVNLQYGIRFITNMLYGGLPGILIEANITKDGGRIKLHFEQILDRVLSNTGSS